MVRGMITTKLVPRKFKCEKCGVISEAESLITEVISYGKPVCLEIEDPEEPGAPNAELRRRRRNFYLRNGIVPIDKMRVYDTDMELLATDERVTFEAYRAVLCSVLGTPYVDSHLERR